jgi:Uma2 family endonuclease
MTTTTRIGMPLDEYLQLSNAAPFELINGERKPKLANAAGHSEVIQVLFLALYTYNAARQLGTVYSETTFILPEAYDSNWVSGSRIPDVMFYVGDKIPVYKSATPDWRERPFPIVPDFVAEVISPTDKYSEVDEKIDVYLQDGVRLIWVIDPQRRKAIVYAPDAEQPLHLSGDAVLDGGDVIPDFQIALPKLFA